jgi:maleate isomerase
MPASPLGVRHRRTCYHIASLRQENRVDNNVRRIGVLAPPGNVAMERELPRYVPDGIAVNHNRMSRPGSEITRESLLAMIDSVDRAAHDLAQAYPEVILYGCTSGSFLAGPGREDELGKRITSGTGIPAYTTSTAVILALRAIAARRVFMITPYPDDVNHHELEFLAHHGVTIHGWDAFRCPTSEDIRKLSSDQVAEKALSHREQISGCDALFLSCTNMLTMDRIELLERELGVPVLSSNQCTLWAALKHMKVDASGVGCGALFETTRQPATAAAA